MDYPSSIWDVNIPGLPQQLTPIEDSDFLSILSKQLNPGAATLQPSLTAQQTLPADLSPPFSEDSSPSPPAAPTKGLSKSTTGAEAGKRDDMRKRTIQQAQSDDEDDDIEGQPQTKSQKEGGLWLSHYCLCSSTYGYAISRTCEKGHQAQEQWWPR